MEPKYSNLVNFMNGEATYTIFAQTSLGGPLHMMQLHDSVWPTAHQNSKAVATTLLSQTHDNMISVK